MDKRKLIFYLVVCGLSFDWITRSLNYEQFKALEGGDSAFWVYYILISILSALTLLFLVAFFSNNESRKSKVLLKLLSQPNKHAVHLTIYFIFLLFVVTEFFLQSFE
jgi:TRAP-type C4-dicarboxylate transport system permease small subunit